MTAAESLLSAFAGGGTVLCGACRVNQRLCGHGCDYQVHPIAGCFMGQPFGSGQQQLQTAAAVVLDASTSPALAGTASKTPHGGCIGARANRAGFSPGSGSSSGSVVVASMSPVPAAVMPRDTDDGLPRTPNSSDWRPVTTNVCAMDIVLSSEDADSDAVGTSIFLDAASLTSPVVVAAEDLLADLSALRVEPADCGNISKYAKGHSERVGSHDTRIHVTPLDSAQAGTARTTLHAPGDDYEVGSFATCDKDCFDEGVLAAFMDAACRCSHHPSTTLRLEVGTEGLVCDDCNTGWSETMTLLYSCDRCEWVTCTVCRNARV